ncbi:pyruvoyl-dependent arginine decarboxylase [Nocardioides sp. SOB77]|uniref:Pyruvoyl-dependent arginine decarboxylase AaxB n=1 Tax=Nocardioides oceani TaxID=3058369 RepID=A0ABT8FLU3_9ACTN|nr:pyruvoyl-dependent arginine decarboxylase [Nocardioides oceani]MDN4175490.1 pyruvoyl-dependent arginine decarboxylase [Nocardioides oceani]
MTTRLDITVRAATGVGRTKLAAYDHALLNAGVGNLNLIKLSSVIPPHSTVRVLEDGAREVLAGGHGDKLYCVESAAVAEHSGETVWAGLGWTTDATTGGLFVEHHGGSEESLLEQITLSLHDMDANRGGGYGPVQAATASAHCTDRPVCALVVATYSVEDWSPKDSRG